MKYTIYMLKDTERNVRKRFMSYAWAEEQGGITFNDYEPVYSGEVIMSGSIAGVLDGLYAIHNREYHKDAAGRILPRSMSVSDVIEIEGQGAWYCEPLGWKKLNMNAWCKPQQEEGE